MAERGIPSGSRRVAASIVKSTIRCRGEAGETTISERLKLWEPLAWIITAFFHACGLRKPGEKTPYPWDKCVGATGTCLLEQRDFLAKDGTETKINCVKRWLPPAAKFTPGQF